MMDDLTRKFFEEAKAIALTDAERAEIREHICTFLEVDLVSTQETERHVMAMTHSSEPIDKGLLGKGDKKSIRQKLVRMMRETSELSIELSEGEEVEDAEPHRVLSPAFLGGLFTRLSVFAVVFIFAGVGISSAAKGSLPGDYLYPYKINVSERMTDMITVSRAARASWNTERTLRRLSEAEALIERGEEDVFVLKNTHEQFLKGLQQSRSSVEAVKAQGLTDEALALTTHLESGLRTYYDSFLSLKHSESAKEWAELFHKDLRESIAETSDMNEIIQKEFAADKKVPPAGQPKKQPAAASSVSDSIEPVLSETVPAVGNALKKQEEEETQNNVDSQIQEVIDASGDSSDGSEKLDIPGKILPDLLKKDDKNVMPL